MKTFKLYVTDISKTEQTLKANGFICQPKITYVEVQAEESEKMTVVKCINDAKIVMLDIE